MIGLEAIAARITKHVDKVVWALVVLLFGLCVVLVKQVATMTFNEQRQVDDAQDDRAKVQDAKIAWIEVEQLKFKIQVEKETKEREDATRQKFEAMTQFAAVMGQLEKRLDRNERKIDDLEAANVRRRR